MFFPSGPPALPARCQLQPQGHRWLCHVQEDVVPPFPARERVHAARLPSAPLPVRDYLLMCALFDGCLYAPWLVLLSRDLLCVLRLQILAQRLWAVVGSHFPVSVRRPIVASLYLAPHTRHAHLTIIYYYCRHIVHLGKFLSELL